MRSISKLAHALLVKGTLRGKKTIEKPVVDKSLRYSTVEGAFTGSSNTIVDSYIIPFALSLHATNIEIGLLNSMKSLAGTIAQIPGATLPNYASRKSIWNISAVVSRLLLIPIILLPFFGNGVLLLIALIAPYQFFASMRTPAWTSLMSDIVPRDMRGRYFGRRNMLIGVAGLVTVLVAGSVVGITGFGFIFGIAVVTGFVSVYFFRHIFESQFTRAYHYTHSISLSPQNLVNAVRINRNFVLLTIFLSLMAFSVNIATPFFIVYQLQNLGIGYGWFAIALVFNALVALASQQYWGRLSDRYGEKKILAVTGILVSVFPLVYMFVYSPATVILAEGFSGFAWAGFDLVAFNFVIAVTPAEKRASYVANHAFFRGIAVVAGAFIGGIVAEHLASSSLFWLAGLQILFLVSFLLRTAALLVIPKLNDAVPRESDIIPVRQLLWQAVAVEPAKGISHTMYYALQPRVLEDIRKKINKLGRN